jgi:hypothetical protein
VVKAAKYFLVSWSDGHNRLLSGALASGVAGDAPSSPVRTLG